MLDAFLIGWLLIAILAWYSNDKPRVTALFSAAQPTAKPTGKPTGSQP